MRQIAPSTSSKMKGGKRKARRRKIAHQSRRSRLMPLWQLAVAAEVRRPSRKTRRRSLRMKGFLNSSVHNATTVGKSRSNIPPTAPTHALEEDADAEAVVAGGRGRGYGRGYTRLRSRSIRSKDYERESTSSGDNLHNHLTKSSVARAARGQRRDVSLARLELYDNRGNTYPIKIVDNFFCVEVAPPLDFDMTIDTTFHQSPAAYAIHALEGLRLLHLRLAHFNETKIKASIAAGAKFGEHKTSADTATKKLTHLCRGALKGKHTTSPNIVNRTNGPRRRRTRSHGHQDRCSDTIISRRQVLHSLHGRQDPSYCAVRIAEEERLRKRTSRRRNEENALANNIHTGTTPPYDKKAGGGTSESLILSDACHGHIIRAPHVPRKYWPIVLKTVAIIYNNMTHGATDKIPSIELFRSPTISLRSALSAPHLRVHTQAAPQRNAPHGSDIYLGFKDAHAAYVYDPVTDRYIRGHRLLSVELATSSDNTISGVDTTPPWHGAPVEGGGGDGLDEVDKFIHDALNQAPPTEGGASPIEGGGEPDLGALGIHGQRTDGQRPGVQAHHADNWRPHLRSLQPYGWSQPTPCTRLQSDTPFANP
ncbi:hypothetical protein RI054_20g88300 [Pseudoscourfieldia marina]